MKTISIMIPCYNEEENVVPISNAVVEMFDKSLPNYNYEILFIDNNSTDKTRVLLKEICRNNNRIKDKIPLKYLMFVIFFFYGLYLFIRIVKVGIGIIVLLFEIFTFLIVLDIFSRRF